MNPHRSPWVTPDHELYRDTVRRFVETEMSPHRDRWIEQQHVDPDMWARAGAIGMLCPDVPTEYGGGGADFGFDAITYEELQRAALSSFGNGIQSIVAHYLVRYGTEAQRQRWLPRMATGEIVGAIAMTEPGAGTDLQRIRTHAVRDGDDYLVSGSKIFITNGLHADLVCVAVKTDAKAGGKGISLVMVETANAEGFSRGAPLDKLGQKTLDTVELFFDRVRVPVTNLLGGVEGQGFVQLMQQLPRERLLIAVGAQAMMQRAIAETLDHVRERQVFGVRFARTEQTDEQIDQVRLRAGLELTGRGQALLDGLELVGQDQLGHGPSLEWGTDPDSGLARPSLRQVAIGAPASGPAPFALPSHPEESR
mgnify:CR=1 FL=1